MSADIRTLIARLNPVCKRSLESAAGLCVSQTHYNVEVEHLLIKLFEAEGTDIEMVFRFYDIDLDRLLRELERSLESFKRGNSRTPAFTPALVKLLEEAWLVASINLSADAIRSGAVILALLKDPTHRNTLVDSCPSLTEIPLERLHDDLPELVQHSEEEGVGASGVILRSDSKRESKLVP